MKRLSSSSLPSARNSSASNFSSRSFKNRVAMVMAIGVMGFAATANAAPIEVNAISTTYAYKGTETLSVLRNLILGNPTHKTTYPLAMENISALSSGIAGSSNKGIYLKAQICVGVADAGVWTLQDTGDFGRGGSLWLDGTRIFSGVGEYSTIPFQASVNMTPGAHVVEVFGFENCCDWPGTTSFKKGNGNWQVIKTSNIATESCVVATDTDHDGVLDIQDNCPAVPNANQLNFDGDAQGDACDADDDNDGVLDVSDNCPFVSNFSQSDNDFDGTGDASEPVRTKIGWLVVRAEKVRPAVTLPFDDVHDKVQAMVTAQRRHDIDANLKRELREEADIEESVIF